MCVLTILHFECAHKMKQKCNNFISIQEIYWNIFAISKFTFYFKLSTLLQKEFCLLFNCIFPIYLWYFFACIFCQRHWLFMDTTYIKLNKWYCWILVLSSLNTLFAVIGVISIFIQEVLQNFLLYYNNY